MKNWTLILLLFSIGQLYSQVNIDFIPSVSGKQINYQAVGRNFNGMLGFQCSLNWNPDSMSYRNITFHERMSSAQINPKLAGEGKIPMVWFSMVKDFQFTDCDTLFTLTFQKVKGLSPLRLSGDPIAMEFVNVGGIVTVKSKVTDECKAGKKTSSGITKGKWSLHSSFLRPGQSMIFKPDLNSGLQIRIIDTTGRTIMDQILSPKGPPIAPRSKGTYIYQISDSQIIIQVGKIVVY